MRTAPLHKRANDTQHIQELTVASLESTGFLPKLRVFSFLLPGCRTLRIDGCAIIRGGYPEAAEGVAAELAMIWAERAPLSAHG